MITSESTPQELDTYINELNDMLPKYKTLAKIIIKNYFSVNKSIPKKCEKELIEEVNNAETLYSLMQIWKCDNQNIFSYHSEYITQFQKDISALHSIHPGYVTYSPIGNGLEPINYDSIKEKIFAGEITAEE